MALTFKVKLVKWDFFLFFLLLLLYKLWIICLNICTHHQWWVLPVYFDLCMTLTLKVRLWIFLCFRIKLNVNVSFIYEFDWYLDKTTLKTKPKYVILMWPCPLYDLDGQGWIPMTWNSIQLQNIIGFNKYLIPTGFWVSRSKVKVTVA